jgi:two-component system chemotaxis response regulator CheB
MVVDDSAVIRGFLTRALEGDDDIAVIESVSNGELALKAIARSEVDIVVLDIEMPVMDGLTALPLILKARPGVKVIMASTLTRKNAAISIQALAAGASDYIPKPSSARELHSSEDFRRDLVAKVKALTGRAITPGVPSTAGEPAEARPRLYGSGRIELRKPSSYTPGVLAVGSSTGGPQALFKLFEMLDPKLRIPILVTQHMPPTFTTLLAENIDRLSRFQCVEAADKDEVKPGCIYIAPGDHHMLVERKGKQSLIRLDQGPSENFCRPAVDPMLRSLIEIYGPRVLGVILTGMGQDGLQGGRAVVEAGGTIIAQDEESSVVWGMPGAVATAGLCSATMPVDQLAYKILRLVGGAGR